MNTDQESKSKKKFVCKHFECGATFEKRRKYEIHCLRHTGKRPFECDVPGCDKSYTNTSHLRRHKKTAHEEKKEPERTVKCENEKCTKTYASVSAMKKHFKLFHMNSYPFSCSDCGQGFYRKNLLQNHEYLHTGILKYSCELCKRKFATTKKYERHKKRHSEYKCDCGKTFFIKREFDNHVKRKHTTPGFQCNECEQWFTTKQNLKSHFSHIHQTDEEKLIYECPITGCDNFYYYKKNLVHHVRIHHEKVPKKKIPCPYKGCTATLSKMQNLLKHIDVHKFGRKKKIERKKRKDAGVKKESYAAHLSGLKLLKSEADKLCNLDENDDNGSVDDITNGKTSTSLAASNKANESSCLKLLKSQANEFQNFAENDKNSNKDVSKKKLLTSVEIGIEEEQELKRLKLLSSRANFVENDSSSSEEDISKGKSLNCLGGNSEDKKVENEIDHLSTNTSGFSSDTISHSSMDTEDVSNSGNEYMGDSSPASSVFSDMDNSSSNVMKDCSIILERCTEKPVLLAEESKKVVQVQFTHTEDSLPNYIVIEYEKDMDIRPENFQFTDQ